MVTLAKIKEHNYYVLVPNHIQEPEELIGKVVPVLMNAMFCNATLANPDTSNWDISNVTDMLWMFYGSAYTGKSL